MNDSVVLTVVLVSMQQMLGVWLCAAGHWSDLTSCKPRAVCKRKVGQDDIKFPDDYLSWLFIKQFFLM